MPDFDYLTFLGETTPPEYTLSPEELAELFDADPTKSVDLTGSTWEDEQ